MQKVTAESLKCWKNFAARFMKNENACLYSRNLSFTEKRDGLFPSMAKIHFNCSCPNWADMCKHVAAVLYGIGSRFDRLIWNGSVNCCVKWVKDNSAVRLLYADSGL